MWLGGVAKPGAVPGVLLLTRLLHIHRSHSAPSQGKGTFVSETNLPSVPVFPMLVQWKSP